MTSHETFMAAIVAAPDDDTLRLVYADWLDERGDPRGEFIRVQMALVGAPPCEYEFPGGFAINCRCRTCVLKRRERELLTEHFLAWTPSVFHTGSGAGIEVPYSPKIGLCGLGFGTVEFHGGFVDDVSMSLAALFEYGSCLARATPLRTVQLTDREPEHVIADDGPYFHWLAGQREAEEYIPGELYAWMPRGKRNRFRWDTAEEAHSALSTACVRWARHKAGLPPIIQLPEACPYCGRAAEIVTYPRERGSDTICLTAVCPPCLARRHLAPMPGAWCKILTRRCVACNKRCREWPYFSDGHQCAEQRPKRRRRIKERPVGVRLAEAEDMGEIG